MKRSVLVIGLLATTLLHASDAVGDRFALRAPNARAANVSKDIRFSAQASAEIRRPAADAPRFTLKSTAATCAPLPDPLFQNGFE